MGQRAEVSWEGGIELQGESVNGVVASNEGGSVRSIGGVAGKGNNNEERSRDGGDSIGPMQARGNKDPGDMSALVDTDDETSDIGRSRGSSFFLPCIHVVSSDFRRNSSRFSLFLLPSFFAFLLSFFL